MNEESNNRNAAETRTRLEATGRLVFLMAAGVLLSVLVSCACGPIR